MNTTNHLQLATDTTLPQLLETDQPVLLDFGGEWCGPCKVMEPILDSVARQYTGKAVVAKIDVEANPQTQIKYGVRNLPTMLFIQNGVVVDKLVGAVPQKKLTEILDGLV